MTTRTDIRSRPSVNVECPWCGEPLEMALDAKALLCAACATEVVVVDELDGTEATLRREDRAAA